MSVRASNLTPRFVSDHATRRSLNCSFCLLVSFIYHSHPSFGRIEVAEQTCVLFDELGSAPSSRVYDTLLHTTAAGNKLSVTAQNPHYATFSSYVLLPVAGFTATC